MPATTVAALMGGDTRAAMEDSRQYAQPRFQQQTIASREEVARRGRGIW